MDRKFVRIACHCSDVLFVDVPPVLARTVRGDSERPHDLDVIGEALPSRGPIVARLELNRQRPQLELGRVQLQFATFRVKTLKKAPFALEQFDT